MIAPGLAHGPGIKRKLYLAFVLLLCLLALFLFLISRFYCGQIGQNSQIVQYRGNAGLTAARLTEMKALDEKAGAPVPFALWNQTPGQRLQNPSTGSSAEVSLIQVAGDVTCALPFAIPMDEYDNRGCLIDEQSAYALFGASNAEGLVLSLDGKEYTIRAVISAPAPVLVVLAGGDTPTPYVSMLGSGNADAFAMRHQLQAATVQNQFYQDMAQVSSGAPILCLLVLLCYLLERAKAYWQEYPLRRTLLTIAIFGGIIACVLFLLFILPSAYIPAKWSDFSHYESAWNAFSSTLSAYFIMEKTIPDLYFSSLLFRALLGLASTALIWFGYLGLRLYFTLEQRDALYAQLYPK